MPRGAWQPSGGQVCFVLRLAATGDLVAGAATRSWPSSGARLRVKAAPCRNSRVGATPAAPAPAPQNAAQNTPAQKKATQPAQGSEDPGEQVFEQNCSRCHAAPEGFSTRISGTIVRHMRVRASLSEKQERELMKYLNP